MPVSKNNKAPEPGFGLYFHWPFCRKKCPYCDFNSHVRETVDQKIWVDALLAELAHYAGKSEKAPLTSIFFGGGTPSLMTPQTVTALIDGASKYFSFDDTIEISLEANPTSAEGKAFSGYKKAGVNRLSMGVQSLQDRFLKFLGREHNVLEARQTIDLATSLFDRISFDLIYALPDQSLQEWEHDLREALTLCRDHISLYQLTIEPNTGFAGSVKRGEFHLPKDELAESMFMLTQEICQDAGLGAYEISNHARAGQECRHNLTYWRYGSYLGIGPGAHGRVQTSGGRLAHQQIRKPETWLEKVHQSRHGTESEILIEDPLDRAEECLLMGLRLSEGVWFENFEKMTGLSFDEIINPDKVKRLIEAGFLNKDQYCIKATDQGRFVLNSVLAELIS
ncbi:MAG: radical SAM family heme chaperone HemW [Sneathiellales bacterium]|nr:radical SAM family heme chaperone HemW [Sneathiellales bacterium]